MTEREKITAAYALNLWTVSISQIIDYNDINVLNQEYDNIMNNLNLENMPKDEALLDIVKEILDEITNLRLNAGDKKIVDKEYQHQLKNAVWSAVPNIGAIFSAADPIAMGFTLATQVGIGYMNYRRNKATYELQYEKAAWQIQRNRIEHLHGLQKQLFETAWHLSENYGFEDRYRLTEKQIEDYNHALMETNSVRRFNNLDAMRADFDAYPAFWYQIGSTANSIFRSETDKERQNYYRERAIECFKKYENLNKFNLLRHDILTASWALEYLELLELSDSNQPDKAKELIQTAEKFSGNAPDVLELCAFSSLRIKDYENARRLFHLLVNREYNSEINTQILSGLYIREMLTGTEDDSKLAKLNYKELPHITRKEFILPLPPEGTKLEEWTPDWNKGESLEDLTARLEQEKIKEKRHIEEAKKRARTFYQKSILVVSENDTDLKAEYLIGLLNETKNMIDPSLPSPIRVTLKAYLKDRTSYESRGMHTILLGDSLESKKLHKVANNGRWDYDNYGLRFVSFGDKTVISVRPLRNKEINGFIKLAEEISQKQKREIGIPQDVKTIEFNFLKDTFGSFDWINVLTGIIAFPLVVLGQSLENTSNGIQAAKNLSAKQKLTLLQYYMATIKYLESQHALIN